MIALTDPDEMILTTARYMSCGSQVPHLCPWRVAEYHANNAPFMPQLLERWVMCIHTKDMEIIIGIFI